MKNTMMLKLTALALVSLMTVACGGGADPTGIGNDEEIGLANKPAPGRSNMRGTIVATGGLRSLSQIGGNGLAGTGIRLVSSVTGAMERSGVTDAEGKFEFNDVPSGDDYLVKVEFSCSADLVANGAYEDMELYVPVKLGDRAQVELLEQLSVSDTNGDSTPDAFEVEAEFSDDSGATGMHRSQHRWTELISLIDTDNDGSFDDETGFDDFDCDGLANAASPDDSGSGNGVGWSELGVKGAIEAIDASSITVGQVEFSIDGNTSWRIGDNRNADPADFSTGMFVEVEAMPDGSGGWIATRVKAEDQLPGGGTGDDPPEGVERQARGVIEAVSQLSISVGGIEFTLNDDTTWRIGDNRDADPASFTVGMFVEVEGVSDGSGVWIALKVKSDNRP